MQTSKESFIAFWSNNKHGKLKILLVQKMENGAQKTGFTAMENAQASYRLTAGLSCWEVRKLLARGWRGRCRGGSGFWGCPALTRYNFEDLLTQRIYFLIARENEN
jgi:hypothetical protein